jgi:anaerobic selenocysteine-containing dehydrogenase
VLLGACESLGRWWPPAGLRANPHDLEKLGVGDGGAVRVKSARGDVVLEAVADESVPRGVASHRLQPRDDGVAAAGALIDVRQPVVDVRMETP